MNSQLTQFQFYDLIRTLRYELRTSFYNLYFLRQSVGVYNKEIESLKSLINVYNDQYLKGNVAFKELARLQAMEFTLENERIELFKAANENQGNIMLLTGDTISHVIKPVLDFLSINGVDAGKLVYTQVLDSGMLNRYDLKAADTQIKLGEANVALQKSLSVPDLYVSGNWDKAGNYVYNYNSISFKMDLPFLNRNQGNIKVAQYLMEESKPLKAQKELEVKNEISKAFSQFIEADKLYKSTIAQFSTDYEKLLDGITKGYQNRTISLLEFIDYYQTYKNSKIEFNKLQNGRLEALENLNLATGITLIK